jgi:hypothetical protein
MAYVEGIVVASNLTNEAALGAVLDELPAVGGDLLDRVEHWRPEDGHGPAGAEDFAAGRNRPETLAAAGAFWSTRPAGLEAKAAWLGPVRKDYRMRYRLDLVRDLADGRRETLSLVRLGPDRFAAYRTVAQAPGR